MRPLETFYDFGYMGKVRYLHFHAKLYFYVRLRDTHSLYYMSQRVLDLYIVATERPFYLYHIRICDVL